MVETLLASLSEDIPFAQRVVHEGPLTQ